MTCFPVTDQLPYLQKQLKKVCDAKLVVDELHKAAVFFNPAMKGPLMYPTAEQNAIISGVRKMCGTTSLTVQPIAATTDTASSFTEFSQFCRYSDTASAVNHADEMSLYQSLPPPVSSKPILEFWQEHAATFPKLYKLAVRVLAIPVSSCSPENCSVMLEMFLPKRELP
ncbi:hypothetical protein RvY_02846-2 [Ramazzottius varieornatus]|uniref:HAT C-terminal dimerisation domain-containing protein n=1 Tax=Ramazzottius varieornatus TaxID=947166 RepID=A0A1D1UL30_RAMVA|nr:hypothetical protein RvY_02846-2 [Ramazzottius varieornatus]